ncbi:hypothetical protein RvY_03069 [Ramazzottius varieornatus]|uniref:Uncharacterized protein n=1 Tax=Ramazzottius varieornatus TaxID=947166 RepID=A0A1D1UX07_RAMVA|nr:hypothetical protein RvY_03069 [Ramazzottius varieornatus]
MLAVMTVIFPYDDDYYHLLPPSKIFPDKILERHDEDIKEKQRHKKALEPGMKLRLFWTAAFNKSKATVYAVGDSFRDMER